MEKTAVQHLADHIKENSIDTFDFGKNGIQTNTYITLDFLQQMIDLEKKQIEDAVNYGYELDFSDDDNTYSKGEEYYYETFKND